MTPTATRAQAVNTPRQVLFASLIGTTIEFFDFYIYATAAVLVFPRLFFPASDPASATLASLATFAIAFLARPIGSALFGHFGDRVGRKTTLVAALLTMGVSTVAIGAAADLRDDRRCGAAAAGDLPLRPGARARRRVGRRGAARDRERAAGQARVVRHVPAARRADRVLLLRRACSSRCREWLTDEQFFSFGWRIPFLASAVLVLVGLYVRLTITETPVFQEAVTRRERVKVPMVAVFRHYPGTLVVGIMSSLATFVLFYLMTVFALAWGTTALGYSREKFLLMQLVGIVFFALTIPLVRDLRRAGPPQHADRGHRRDRFVRAGDGAAVRRRHHRRGADDGHRPVVDGVDLRTARHGAVGALSDVGPLHRQLA